MNRAIFIDRDGVINSHIGYVNCLDDFHILPGVANALKLLKQAGYKIFIVTNQAGIERGYLTHDDLEEIHSNMRMHLPEIDDIRYCPSYNSFDRKPNPGMIYDLALEYEIHIGKSWMIGDMVTDIEAGINAGCKTCMVVSSIEESIRAHDKADAIVDSLYEATIMILEAEGYL